MILLTPEDRGSLGEALLRCRGVAQRVGLICTCENDVLSAEEHAFDFVVAKGCEAGGKIGNETTFILLQRLTARQNFPVYAWGGIGLHTAAACRIAGAAGLCIDWQLSLTRESGLAPKLKRRIEALDGSETAVVSPRKGEQFRFFARPGATVSQRLESMAQRFSEEPAPAADAWRRAVASLMKSEAADERLWPMGQDACFASSWRAEAATVARSLEVLRERIDSQSVSAAAARTLGSGGPLARSHGTEFPIVQGPMTRVSDVPEFCAAVARAGALPFLALALMKKADVSRLLRSTRETMGDRPWGVGILGFVDAALRAEQLEAIGEFRPPFAIVAGGRPDQAAALERNGTKTYLHVPSPELLRFYIAEGARRFVFEGSECGGHVGPRTSFVLWDTMVQVLRDADLSEEDAARVHVVFAGGIHDGLSGSIAATIGQGLVERGMKVGVVAGSAYLFTKELVSTGAATQVFQDVAMAAKDTAVLNTGPGHSIRCAPTEYANHFERKQRELLRSGRPKSEIRDELEHMHVGRLRIASKGLTRDAEDGAQRSGLTSVSGEDQRRSGMYMMGQLAALHGSIQTMRELHEEICDGSGARFAAFASQPRKVCEAREPAPPPLDVAIVGMGCLLPGAANVKEYWQNILEKRDAIGEIPEDHFDYRRWFDSDRSARDKIYSKWGGFLDDVPFDPLKYGIPPSALKSIEPMQLLALEVVDQALRDAGYAERNPHRARTSTILGVGGGLSELGSTYTFRALLPQYVENADETMLSRLPEWTEDSFPGILLNVVAGRIANRFDFGGVNYVVDAACASSLTAVYDACRELAAGTSDMVITGGCDTVQNPLGYVCFSKTGALSPRGRSRTFDASADGIAISEGLAVVVLKRREDAERDGDRIYALIRAVAGGSDGRSKGLTAPHREGQMRVIERAYLQAGFGPDTVGLIEAHGTGTVVGDQTECEALAAVLARYNAARRSVAIGGVKSMIGHTKCAAGVAGLIKASLALYTRVLPPTLHVETPNPKAGLGAGVLYVNSELRPWIKGGHARRAGVSAFGFGGSNFHAVLEEYADDAAPRVVEAPREKRPAELIVLSAASAEELAARARELGAAVRRLKSAKNELRLADVAFTVHGAGVGKSGTHRVAIVASEAAQLEEQLAAIAEELCGGPGREGTRQSRAVRSVHRGVHYGSTDACAAGEVAFLFPGQGSQHPNMLCELAVEFAEVRERFEVADEALRGAGEARLSGLIFPRPGFTEGERAAAFEALKNTDVAQPALGACDVAMMRLLESFGVRPAMVAGHSYGELVALHAAKCLDESNLYKLSRARGDCMTAAGKAAGGADLGGMLAAGASGAAVSAAIAGCASVWIANLNGPRQTIISGSRSGLEKARARLTQAGLSCVPVPVACAFHSPLMEPARDTFAKTLADVEFRQPGLPVYSNVTAGAYSGGAEDIRRALAEQLTSRVRFAEEIEAMYAAGGRVFVEAGPGNVLTKLVGQILSGRPHVAVSTQTRGGEGLVDFLEALARLMMQGVAVDLDRLYEGRGLSKLELNEPVAPQEPEYGPNTWLVNGAYVRPAREPKRSSSKRVRMEERRSKPASLSAAPAGVAQKPGAPAVRDAGTLKQPQQEARGRGPATDGTMERHPPGSEDVEAFAQFQDTMRLFLHTQRAAMEAFLGTGGTGEGCAEMQSAESGVADGLLAPPTRIAGTPGTAPDVGEEAADVKAAPADETRLGGAPRSAAVHTCEMSLEERLKRIVSERTGYPPEMLDLDVNVESDLGIDSIKRVEIIGTFRRSVLPELKEPPAWFMERMSQATTLRECVAGVVELRGREGVGVATAKPAGDLGDSARDGATEREIDLDQRVKQIVSERTGYPVEMLDLDANMEADLGIDSIKRVEIIGTFRRSIFPAMAEPPAWFMERISGVSTMREICAGVAELMARQDGRETRGTARDSQAAAAPDTAERDRIVSGAAGDMGAGTGAEKRSTGEVQGEADGASPRCAARAASCPLANGSVPRVVGATVLLTGDGHGVAKALAREIESRGGRPVTLKGAAPASRAEAERLVSELRGRDGRIGAVVHLRPLRDAPTFPGASQSAWRSHIDEEIKSLLFILQALAPELKSAADGSFAVVAATRGGGEFVQGRAEEAVHPWRGGIAGLLKTAAREWPGARFRAVDTDELPSVMLLMGELAADGPVEIGYRGDERYTMAAVREELPSCGSSITVSLDESSVVLVTGGARGITAQIAHEIGLRSRARLVLLGRSAAPAGEEDRDTAGIEDPIELRKVLIRKSACGGTAVTPKSVESALGRLLREREIRRTLQAIADTAAAVEYHSCDVCDAAALRSVVEDVNRRHGGIDALVHGAGVIEDRYIVDKEAGSFDRVVGTKVEPLVTLTEALDPARLKFAMLFSSVAGFYGNAGQGDYAAANEILNRAAHRLNVVWPGKVVALNWGPWSGAGMVTADVASQFEERGVGMVSVPAGRLAAWREISGAKTNATTVIIGPGPWVDGGPSAGGHDAAAVMSASRA